MVAIIERRDEIPLSAICQAPISNAPLPFDELTRRSGAHGARVEVSAYGVMELPTVQTNEHASTNPSASNSVFSNLQG